MRTRAVAAIVALPLALAGCAHTAPARQASRSADGGLLDVRTVVRRCLPQLTTYTWAATDVRTLSVDTVRPVHPELGYRAGDVVGFVALTRPGSHRWARLNRPCRVPARQVGHAPGSAPMPGSSLIAEPGRSWRNRQLCASGALRGEPRPRTMPDVRSWRARATGWRSSYEGVVVLTQPHGPGVVACSLVATTARVRPTVPSLRVRRLAYFDGYVSSEPDSYLVAGSVPPATDGRAPTRIVVRTPTKEQSFAVHPQVGTTSGLGGTYAFSMSFPPVWQNYGTVHSDVWLEDADGRVLWHGRWKVGTFGR